MIYKPVRGSRLTDKQAQRYGERIGALMSLGHHGSSKMQEQAIINDAKAKESPLHDFFEWDDTVAASEYRLEQARYLLRNIQVVVRIDDREEEIRAFHNVIVRNEKEGESKRIYVQIDQVLNEVKLREQIVQQALDALISWKKKYKQYKELAGVVEAINVLQDAMR